jgi:hypothetical protein
MSRQNKSSRPATGKPWWVGSRPDWDPVWGLGGEHWLAPDPPPQTSDAAPPPNQTAPEDLSTLPGWIALTKNGVRTPPDTATAKTAAPQPAPPPAPAAPPAGVSQPSSAPAAPPAAETPVPAKDAAAPIEGVHGQDWRSRRRRRRNQRREHPQPRSPWPAVVFLGLLVLAMMLTLWIYQSDLQRLEDADLGLGPPSAGTPVSIRAPQRLIAVLGSMDATLTDQQLASPPSSWGAPELADFLLKNSRALDNLKDLLEEPDEEWAPRHPDWYERDLGSHPNWTALAMLKQAEAAYSLHRGDAESALAASLDLAELARRLQDTQAWPSIYLISLEAHRRACESLAAILPRGLASAAALASFQEQFTACLPSEELARSRVLPSFYQHEKRALLGPLPEERWALIPPGLPRVPTRRFFFKPLQTLDTMAKSIRALSVEVGKTSAMLVDRGDIWDLTPDFRPGWRFAPNSAGIAYAARRMEIYRKVPGELQLARTRHLLVLQLCAMRRFIAERNGLPGMLGDLVPAYFPHLPADPFSGRPFRYDPVTGVIYSVGQDMMDNGGQLAAPPLTDPDEPTVSIGARQAGGR